MSVTFAAFRENYTPESQIVGSHGPLEEIWMDHHDMMARWCQDSGQEAPPRTLRPTDAQLEEAGICSGPNVSASNAVRCFREIGFADHEAWKEGCFPLNVEEAISKIATFIADGRGDEYTRTFALQLYYVVMTARNWNLRDICGA